MAQQVLHRLPGASGGTVHTRRKDDRSGMDKAEGDWVPYRVFRLIGGVFFSMCWAL